jgi:hypothetical protein
MTRSDTPYASYGMVGLASLTSLRSSTHPTLAFSLFNTFGNWENEWVKSGVLNLHPNAQLFFTLILGSGVQDLSRCPGGRVQYLSCAALVQDKSCIPVTAIKIG